ncbi:DUF2147 domain-containing protein [Hymenobacter canadensis]|uniref:DUF2147 domain-containing protein n=1 Tax=Hymenobacter canadensis TaxID=2999067 RepID=A0ABY7LW17_9BACT|nr:DUF2147 domain-containing protein [Hymenobacter canadensis]WBA44127.1 DUF2147 domain-containing protein [Hymenobacter canadensis]
MQSAKTFLLALVLLLGLVLRTAAQQPAPAAPILGTWLSEDWNGKITFTQAPDQTYTATITWVQPGADDSKLKVGDVIAKGLKGSKNQYAGGQLYAAKRGRWVNGAVYLPNPRTLELKGSVGPMSQTQTWTRVAAN